MAVEKVKEYFSSLNILDKVCEVEVSTATVALAAEAIGCKPENIAKSMTFYGNENDIIMVVTAGDRKIDNQKFKAEFSFKAKMVAFDDTEKLIGHAAGGICPFALNENVKVYLDESLKPLDPVYPAAGSSNSFVKLNVEELEKYSKSIKWVDVCKIPEA